MITFTDNTLMPFGQYKGYKMANVPADYLLYILGQDWLQDGGLKEYIKKNKADLEQEVKLNKKMNNR